MSELAVECQEEFEMDIPCPTQEQVLAELEKLAPGAPFLALGQTVFWDEPMKAGVILRSQKLGYSRRFVAGVHDTDYFAKFHHNGKNSGYQALPHNDTTTKSLWSAAGEFSVLFGSETVVTKELLQHYGAKLARIQTDRPGYLDEVTEAWGWRGVVSFGPEARITAEKPLEPVFPAIFETFNWAVTQSLSLIAGPHRKESEFEADHLRALVCNASDGDGETLSGYYRSLLPELYSTVASEPVSIETTATTELLRFNTTTCNQPRFDLFGLFVASETRKSACDAYDQAVSGTEMYKLERFGVGALPFDLYVPGIGRGTLRLGTKGGLVMSPEPVGFSYKKAPTNLQELAAIIEKRFGPNCVLVGKAVTLIGMLAREFVFVFHDGASSYVKRSRAMHQALAASGSPLKLNPVLRVRLEPWPALNSCCAWFKLPEPVRRPFGVDELSGCSLSARWSQVAAEQRSILEKLETLRRPLDLVRFLHTSVGGQWNCLATQYESLHQKMIEVNDLVAEVKGRKAVLLGQLKQAVSSRIQAERAKGNHWREKIFEKSPTPDGLSERVRLSQAVDNSVQNIADLKLEWRKLQAEQDAIVESEETERGRELRRNIALEAELTRVKMIRESVLATEGLSKSGHRPAAWWFPLVCPDGTWFRATSKSAHYWLEHLT